MDTRRKFLRPKLMHETWRILTLLACILFSISALNPFFTANPRPRFYRIAIIGLPEYVGVQVFWSFKTDFYLVNLSDGTRILQRELYFWDCWFSDWSGYSSLYGYDGSPILIATVLLLLFATEISVVSFGILALLGEKRCPLLLSTVSAVSSVLLMWFFPVALNGSYMGTFYKVWFYMEHYGAVMLIAAAIIRCRRISKRANELAKVSLVIAVIATAIPTLLFFYGSFKLIDFAIHTGGNFQIAIEEYYDGFTIIKLMSPEGTGCGVTEYFFTMAGGCTLLFISSLFFILKELMASRSERR